MSTIGSTHLSMCSFYNVLPSVDSMSFTFQALAGPDVPKKAIDQAIAGLRLPDRAGVVCVDLCGYDGFPVEACISSTVNKTGPKQLFGTICHNIESKKFVTETIDKMLHNLTRTGLMSIEGFPKLQETLKRLKDSTNAKLPLQATFSLCKTLADGTLIVPSSLVKGWSGSPEFEVKINNLLEAHDKEFNPEHKEDLPDNAEDEPVAKRKKLEVAHHNATHIHSHDRPHRDNHQLIVCLLHIPAISNII